MEVVKHSKKWHSKGDIIMFTFEKTLHSMANKIETKRKDRQKERKTGFIMKGKH